MVTRERNAAITATGVFTVVVLLLLRCSESNQPISWSDTEMLRIEKLVDSVSSTRMFANLLNIARNRHPTNDSVVMVDRIFPDIFSEFRSCGLEIFSDQFYGQNHPEIINIYALKQGSDTAASPVVLTAHWDAVLGGPGADDNASGCAALLETAKVLSDVPLRRSVLFIMFAIEEWGYFGSYAHMKRFHDQPPHILINLDCIAYTTRHQQHYPLTGFPSTGDFIMIAGLERDREFAYRFCDVIDRFIPQLPYYCLIEDEELANNPILENLQHSDHMVFWEQKQPAFFLTDTGPMRNPNYHKPTDLIATLDLDFLRKVTAATVAFVYTEARR